MAGAAVPNLQSILATLSQFTSPDSFPSVSGDQRLGIPESVPSLVVPQRSSWAPELPSVVTSSNGSQKSQDPRSRPQVEGVTTAKPIDPATIINWQEGLRCVTKIAAQNVQFATAIRKMMEEQRRHEILWYKERQSLKQVQLARANSSAQAMSILQTLGSQTTNSSTLTAPKLDPTLEMAEYDRKVYAAQQRMEVAMTVELKGLGVPFFGTEDYLVVPDTFGPSLNQPPEIVQGTLTESELLNLKRRMVIHLEDLYRD